MVRIWIKNIKVEDKDAVDIPFWELIKFGLAIYIVSFVLDFAYGFLYALVFGV